ncbi:MAG: ATP-binding protein [Myxococcota bacterium]
MFRREISTEGSSSRRQRELENDWAAMKGDVVGRDVAAAFAMAMVAYMVSPYDVLPWAIAYGIIEALVMWTLWRVVQTARPAEYTAHLLMTGVLCMVYAAPGVLLWMEPNTYEKICGFIYIFGGVIFISTVRISHLPFGLAGFFAHLSVQVALPVSYYLDTNDLEATLLLGASILATMGYFLTILLNNHRLLNTLETERARADLASAAKSRFVAAMSHEIRTPLNGILGVGQLLQAADDLSDDHHHHVDLLMRSGRSLKVLVDDVLDLAKIEAGRMEIAPAEADLHMELRTVQHLFTPTAAEKGTTIHLDIDDSVPQFAIMDALRVRQCLNNLVSNAVKFTDSGVVRIAARARPGGHAPATVRLTVSVIDTGPGIPKEAIGKLFEQFQQVDVRRDARSGTGLGLPISRQMAQLMGGDIRVESVPGQGSTFHLDICIERVDHTTVPVSVDEHRLNAHLNRQGVKALVVDDVSTNRFVVAAFLRAAGVTVEETPDGERALARIHDQDFDVVLMDSSMPGMSGAETLAAMRQAGIHAPVIAFTADAMEGDRERYLKQGFDGYVSKPIDRRLLLVEITRVLPRAEHTHTDGLR